MGLPPDRRRAREPPARAEALDAEAEGATDEGRRPVEAGAAPAAGGRTGADGADASGPASHAGLLERFTRHMCAQRELGRLARSFEAPASEPVVARSAQRELARFPGAG